ncbi:MULTISPECIES: alpha/beta fold hydrolase [Rhizobium]|uniref:alpha/beta fold hydrolase n=1 Tax=Rhizobium TaxID=379 RepID=UPI0014428674|nr:MULTISPECIES: alpha/beta hydrolase [Rhizobium]MBY3132868.1 alpha/beta hydrolase [Rhizobium laguerreae]MBY3155985.1 alpha/beta hydrolase [Rhizobium laguerreae]MBY5669704.1 alpha/beta hydrolase [Rhizobium leguminosarum]MBY5838959.1 alpha/beta hydrolase [Rhizobium leguminosarum]NKL77001.1 alpha/beta fold hydrolase [Rhizobium leguminosarum bv. viciae]
MSWHRVRYKKVNLGEVEMFYREVGAEAAPVLLLLHGFPTSSHMYRDLILQLADRHRIVAPDLPGFGSTKAPARGAYAYTFGNLYKAVLALVDTLKLERFGLMVFDYGAPVGFRLAAAYPNRISAIITQNGNVYEVGLREANIQPMRAYWENPSPANRDALRSFLTIDATRFQYTHGVPEDKLELVSPDAVAHDQAILDRDPEVQLDLFGDYKSNIALYPRWQEYLRATRPPVLAVWGKGDPFFAPAGAHAFRNDVPDAEIHLFDTGHFALETDGPEIAALIRDFLGRKGC